MCEFKIEKVGSETGEAEVCLWSFDPAELGKQHQLRQRWPFLLWESSPIILSGVGWEVRLRSYSAQLDA